jgi:hypothetical protein
LTFSGQKGGKGAERGRSEIAEESGLSEHRQKASDSDGSEDAFSTRLPAYYAHPPFPFFLYL